MSLLHDVYTALLSGLTYKTGNEIHWNDKNGNPITIEPIDINQNKYIIRRYFKNGQKHWETEYQNGKRHGKSINWYESGNKWFEAKYQNGKLHGKNIYWYENGNKAYEHKYQNGKLL
jgi:antitoxin component YwqK of YwqJK toxin-antitoxin module